jgi:hypothetical protein
MKPGQCACRRSPLHSYVHLLVGLGILRYGRDFVGFEARWLIPRRFLTWPWREWPRRLAEPGYKHYWERFRPFTRAWLWYTFWPS